MGTSDMEKKKIGVFAESFHVFNKYCRDKGFETHGCHGVAEKDGKMYFYIHDLNGIRGRTFDGILCLYGGHPILHKRDSDDHMLLDHIRFKDETIENEAHVSYEIT
jgi:hypothetical protein